jgi:hypothetical protein
LGCKSNKSAILKENMIKRIKVIYTTWFYNNGYLNIYEQNLMFRFFYRKLFDNETYLELIGREYHTFKDSVRRIIQCKKLSGNYNEELKFIEELIS